jgi:hypothetical protein
MLARIIAKTPTGISKFDGTAEFVEEGFKLLFENHKNITGGMSQSCLMLLDCLMIKATELKDLEVVMPLKELFSKSGLVDSTVNRNQVKRDLIALQQVQIEYKARRSWLIISLNGGTIGVVGENIIFSINPAFLKALHLEEGKYL